MYIKDLASTAHEMSTPCPKHPAHQTQVEPQPITAQYPLLSTALREPRRVNKRKGPPLSHNKAKKRLSKAGRHVAPAVEHAVASPAAPETLSDGMDFGVDDDHDAPGAAPETLSDGMDFRVDDDHDPPVAASSSGCWPQSG